MAERESATSPSLVLDLIRRMAHTDTMALVGALRYDTADAAIGAVLDRGGAVVHAWGDQDSVSPQKKNDMINEHYRDHHRYESHVLRGFGHAATDLYVLNGALARQAHGQARKP